MGLSMCIYTYILNNPIITATVLYIYIYIYIYIHIHIYLYKSCCNYEIKYVYIHILNPIITATVTHTYIYMVYIYMVIHFPSLFSVTLCNRTISLCHYYSTPPVTALSQGYCSRQNPETPARAVKVATTDAHTRKPQTMT